MAGTRSRAAAPAPAPAPMPAGPDNRIWPVVKDAAVALKLTLQSDGDRLLRCFVFVPLGIFAMLAACFGVDCLMALGGVAFPASVACLVVLFFALLLCDYIFGSHTTNKLVHLVNIPGGWSLRTMNIFFTPSYVMLPLSPRISATEVGKIIGVFVVGFLVMMAFSAYLTRYLQLLKSPPRKAMHQRAEEVQRENEELTSLHGERREAGVSASGSNSNSSSSSRRPSQQALLPEGAEADLARLMPPAPPRSHAAAYITVRGQNLDDPLSSFSDVLPPPPRIVRPVRPPRPRAERWAAWANAHADMLLFSVVFLFVGVPVYYATGYAMPLQLMVNVLMFLCVLELPPSWRQVLHPVIVSAFSTLLCIWLLGRVRGDSLAATLAAYRPGNTYLKLWHNAASAHPVPALRPGAGDVLSSAMDASIVSLALPMYQYRYELRRHFLAIVLPNIVLSITSLFAYPVVCHAIGISPERSLAFTSRSLTLALATPAVRNLGGDLNTVSAIAIISGVLGVLIGRRLLSMLRIPDDDYVTRGVAFGANASALGTALLLRTDPRAAAISSLAMSLFGTITVTFSSIPAMVHIIRSLVGLS